MELRQQLLIHTELVVLTPVALGAVGVARNTVLDLCLEVNAAGATLPPNTVLGGGLHICGVDKDVILSTAPLRDELGADITKFGVLTLMAIRAALAEDRPCHH